MSAPVWLVSTGASTPTRPLHIHAVRDGRPLCGTPTAGWRAARPGMPRCYRCVVATSPDKVTQHDMVSVGITYRQLDYWTRNGWLDCVLPASGSGSQRLYSRYEIQIAAVMAKLVAAGVTPEAASRAARTGYLADGVRVLVTDPVDIEAVA